MAVSQHVGRFTYLELLMIMLHMMFERRYQTCHTTLAGSELTVREPLWTSASKKPCSGDWLVSSLQEYHYLRLCPLPVFLY